MGDGARPGIADFARDDIDDAAHGVGPVQGGHRAAHHFNAFDGIQRRHETELSAAEAIRIDIADIALPTPVDKDQGVISRQAPHGDAEVTVLVGAGADVDAFHIAQGIGQAGVRPRCQGLAINDGDAGRCVGELLIKTGGRGNDGDRGQLISGAGIDIGIGGISEGRAGGGGYSQAQ